MARTIKSSGSVYRLGERSKRVNINSPIADELLSNYLNTRSKAWLVVYIITHANKNLRTELLRESNEFIDSGGIL